MEKEKNGIEEFIYKATIPISIQRMKSYHHYDLH